MRVRDIFHQMKAAIDQAAAQKQYDLPIKLAVQLGFEAISPPTSLNFEGRYFADDGAIKFVYRSWDPSGPFQILPDINRYFLTLHEPADRYSLDYPD